MFTFDRESMCLGMLLSLSGTGFLDNDALKPLYLCQFGIADTRPATFVSNTTMLCNAPTHDAGVVYVRAVLNGVSYAANGAADGGAKFTFYREQQFGSAHPLCGPLEQQFSHDCPGCLSAAAPTANAMVPVGGPLAGGGRLTVTGANFADHGLGNGTVMCRIGEQYTAGEVAAARPTEMVCGVPAVVSPRPVEVAVTLNGVDYHSVMDGPAAAEYRYYGAALAPTHRPACIAIVAVLCGS